MRIGVFTLVGNGCEQLCALACSHWLGTVVNSYEQLCALACSHWLGTVVNSCAHWRVHIGWERL